MARTKKTKTELKETNESPGADPIVCHVDKIVLWMGNLSINLNMLDTHEKFAWFIENIATGFSQGGYRGPEYYGTWPVKSTFYIFDQEISRLRLKFNSKLYDYLYQNRCLPSWQEMRNSRVKWLAQFEITHTQKTRYIEHMTNIKTVIQLLEKESFELSVGQMEIAVDTRDKESGEFIRKFACVKNPPAYKHIYHIVTNGEEKTVLPGPSPDGNDEYHGYRPKGKEDREGRPEGGRKQLFSYMADDGTGTKFQRVELRLYRRIAKDLRLAYGPSVLDVVNKLEDILKECLWFRKLDLERLLSTQLKARFLKLDKIATTKGQWLELRKAGFSDKLLRNYIKTLNYPKISYPPYPL